MSDGEYSDYTYGVHDIIIIYYYYRHDYYYYSFMTSITKTVWKSGDTFRTEKVGP